MIDFAANAYLVAGVLVVAVVAVRAIQLHRDRCRWDVRVILDRADHRIARESWSRRMKILNVVVIAGIFLGIAVVIGLWWPFVIKPLLETRNTAPDAPQTFDQGAAA